MIGERRTEVGSEGGVDPGVAVTEFREQWELLHFNFQKWSKNGILHRSSLPPSLFGTTKTIAKRNQVLSMYYRSTARFSSIYYQKTLCVCRRIIYLYMWSFLRHFVKVDDITLQRPKFLENLRNLR